MVMRKHQRYFPVFAPSGGLLPAFVTVANGPVDAAAVAAGNEAVLRARFEDAAFFYNEDLKHPLQEFRCELAVRGVNPLRTVQLQPAATDSGRPLRPGARAPSFL
jgi:glycyl-tRNA synthetase beta subunit